MNRPVGRALVVGGAHGRAKPVEILQRMYGYQCAESDDPYSAMQELCERKTVYNALVLSLAGLYREELAMIGTVKQRFPQVEIWLTHTDGRQADLAAAMRLGADGLLGDEGLHRIAPLPAMQETQERPDVVEQFAAQRETPAPDETGTNETRSADEPVPGEPVLSSDELRALLQDQPTMPPSSPLPPGEG